jgi:hypothetical protein
MITTKKMVNHGKSNTIMYQRPIVRQHLIRSKILKYLNTKWKYTSMLYTQKHDPSGEL